MYKFKQEKRKEIKSKYKLSFIADEVGISLAHLSRIINGRINCTKMTAYCITKMLDQEKEISEYFEQI